MIDVKIQTCIESLADELASLSDDDLDFWNLRLRKAIETRRGVSPLGSLTPAEARRWWAETRQMVATYRTHRAGGIQYDG